jgi:hypothetical protein
VNTFEQELRGALRSRAATVRPAPDLSARVWHSVEVDRRRGRGRWWRRLAAGVGGVTVTAFLIWGMTGSSSARPQGGTNVSWWMLELATTAVLVAIAIWLGPFIKRYGRAYAADVFHDNPLTGKSYIVLTDIVYYLIFIAYIMFTMRFEPELGWGYAREVTADQIGHEVRRVAGILLIIGVLHGVNIVLLPVLGRLFALNRRLPEPTTLTPSQREAIDRVD